MPARSPSFVDDLTMLLARLKARYWWDRDPAAATHPFRIIRRAMDIGVEVDLLDLERIAGRDLLIDALTTAPAGSFRPQSWSYWHYRLRLTPCDRDPPPMPTRRTEAQASAAGRRSRSTHWRCGTFIRGSPGDIFPADLVGTHAMDAFEQTGHAVQAALGHFKASTGTDVDPVAFAKSLASGRPTALTEFALEAHLREADPAELANLVIEGSASFQSLKTLADRLLPPDHPNQAYIARFLP